jgi:hypothetical protein
VAPAAVMVTLLYWILLFPIFGYTTVVDVHLHLINALIILADLWVSRLPYWLLHFPCPLAYLSLYIIFAGIYFAAGGVAPDGQVYIYPWLDFERPAVTVPIVFFVLFVVFPAVHSALWGLERRSRQLAKRRFERQEAEWVAAVGEEEVKDEWATHPGETGRRRRQRRQRLVSPPRLVPGWLVFFLSRFEFGLYKQAGGLFLILPHELFLVLFMSTISRAQGTSSGRPHPQRYDRWWPWPSRRSSCPLTPDELPGGWVRLINVWY